MAAGGSSKRNLLLPLALWLKYRDEAVGVAAIEVVNGDKEKTGQKRRLVLRAEDHE